MRSLGARPKGKVKIWQKKGQQQLVAEQWLLKVPRKAAGGKPFGFIGTAPKTGNELMITVTESARNKIESMCIESSMVAVRPFVQGTGCSGMTHSLTFADQKLERDTEVTPYLIVDPSCLSVYGRGNNRL